MKYILLILSIILLIVVLWFSRSPYMGCLTLITGALKSGKTCFGLHCALRKYRFARIKWHLICIWRKLIKKPLPEEPLFYTNITVAGVPFVPVTEDMLFRRVRVAFKSVMFLSETSLIADSMTLKDALLNEDINTFFKLYGHETHGGKLIIETQNVLDNHYGIKRNINFYYSIDANFNLPFFILIRFYKVFYSDDDTISNVNILNSSVDFSYMLISKKIFTQYDSYTYSWLTDELPLIKETNYIKRHRRLFYYGDRRLKTKEIPTFKRHFKTLLEEAKENNKKCEK